MSRRRQNAEDQCVYQKFLEATKDSDGVVHRDLALVKFRKHLEANKQRISEYAEARAKEVADSFDDGHKPTTEHGQMALFPDTYLPLGDNERVRADEAMLHHTRKWIDLQVLDHARQVAAWAAKHGHSMELLGIQEEHKCSMWKAEQIRLGKA